jgi:HD-GYP domain-containing protein (c-di-GMP phosphodiesterase class II)
VGGDPSGLILFDLPQIAVPLELYKGTLTALHDLMTLVGAGANPEIHSVLRMTEKMTLGIFEGEDSFLPLTSVHYRNQFTFNHSVNVCLLVTAALRPFVKSPERLFAIGQAALLHDLGKSLVPEELFYKKDVPGKDEQAEIERHPRLGAEVLQDWQNVDPLSVVVAFNHHRRPTGEGYPPVKRNRPVDLLTSLVAAADIFEALTAERPYKKSLSPGEAFEVFLRLPEAQGLESAVRLLFNALSPFPPGTLVELTTGEVAVVTRVRPGAHYQPCVRLVSPPGSALSISAEEKDLSRQEGPPGSAISIRRALPERMDPDLTLGGSARVEQEAESDAGRHEFSRRVAEGTLLASEG